ncbi:WxcM-like domain-containing protein [Tenacibaculum finnmarkense genomovar finnmarkense]|uniref:Sugar epimerase n=2 Tax=Tenacibaculum finnmarkense TaxID=2781243 RepID=A0A2I2M8D0_9FLAO|nr:WxcM-like domain-containing protein [Tenacibaculum finnmarkense]ALU74184.1 sugar epimerase [Tenacibaculum dicentrarchi]MBE7634757.1 sugar epimerase [Tenacibaculum finnmarkense genomovar ulcerans]MBE7646450.1 sugar epimerase [Tenacibaculum finnmarkense genomovar ulcerans]MBE7648457.1 sugar epimerase [Tenacibaculum finnmarkense genomovar ulcerans]MBE7652740.1 sugar epimerase [Tenacibaculum finnmarkense genomovar finnmarkense]
MEKTKILSGGNFSDQRGTLTFNNDFDMSAVKRIYTLQNTTTDFVRGWQGHTIEQRWFSCLQGSIKVQCIELDSSEEPNKDLPIEEFILSSESLDVLHIPAGYVTAIQTLSNDAKLVSMSDYKLGEVDDVVRYPLDYFNSRK